MSSRSRPEIVAKIIEKERPDAVLPTMGGQTALNTALALFNDGTLEKYGVQMIGADADAIDKAEDRQQVPRGDGQDRAGSARSGIAHTMEEALEVLERTGLPSIIRPSFTMGGTGGGVAYNKAEFARSCQRPRCLAHHRGADRGIAARLERI
jgi:carbamoyl-phosphate synthase large subunit